MVGVFISIKNMGVRSLHLVDYGTQQIGTFSLEKMLYKNCNLFYQNIKFAFATFYKKIFIDHII